MPKISLVMIVKNEEKHLNRCLNSVKGIVDEIIVVDTGSTDNTKFVARKFNAKIFDFKWIDDFSAARNFALDQSTGDWNLILDADEYIVNDCREEIHKFLEQNEHSIGRIKVINKFSQNSETRYSSVYISRLIPKGIKFRGRIHEQIESNFVRKKLDVEVFHDGYFQKDKADRNLKILLLELKENPNDDYLLYQIGKQYKLKEHYDLAEKYFEQSYKLVSLSKWYRSLLIVDYLYVTINIKSFNKGLQIIQAEKKRLEDMPDFHFVCGLFYMELAFHDTKMFSHLLHNIEKCFLKCLEIGDSNKYDSVIGTGSFLASYNLGVYYEILGMKEKAVKYYKISSEYNYGKAKHRMNLLINS